MASDNQVILVGNLTDDPELRYTPNGAAVCKFRIAVNRRIQDASGQWKDGEASYFSINCWRGLAENAAETLTRGTRVLVAGRLQYRSWENQEGEKRSAVEVEADEIGPSLKWATAKGEKHEKAWKKQKRKVCIFCKDKVDHVDYKDVMTLRKFVSERGKIRARRVTGNCVQHQRDVATAVKNAREMALLPYS